MVMVAGITIPLNAPCSMRKVIRDEASQAKAQKSEVTVNPIRANK
jgi:hypothetical protein